MSIGAAGSKWVWMAGVLLVGRLAFAESLTLEDSGKTIQLPPGGELEVVLQGNPTTGYAWTVEECATNVLQATGEPQYTADSPLIGAGGVYQFVFKAESAGSGMLKLIYHRSWETNVPPEKTFCLLVNVVDAAAVK